MQHITVLTGNHMGWTACCGRPGRHSYFQAV